MNDDELLPPANGYYTVRENNDMTDLVSAGGSVASKAVDKLDSTGLELLAAIIMFVLYRFTGKWRTK